jgi:hypothetical protein
MTRYVFWDQIPARRSVSAFIEDIDDEEVILVRNSSYDVTVILQAQVAVVCSDGNSDAGPLFVRNNASWNLYDDGVDILTLTVNADGSVKIQRTAGTKTFVVNIEAIWI